ncbi:histidine kinase [Microbispora sp. NPDC046933]|uniref:histidine kinase n=1 Tax=Microbispora sp. NPDC046933 TaxID=3155618 RepID=UPI0033F98B79
MFTLHAEGRSWRTMVISAVAHLGVMGGLAIPALVVAVSALLFAVARAQTSGVSLSAMGVVTAVAVLLVAWGGAPARVTAAGGVLALGVGAGIRMAGRARRRRAAARRGRREFLRHAAAVPRDAARAERARFAAELHDVVGHRLTGVVVTAGAALRLDDPELRAAALRHAAEAGRAALAELDALGASLDPARSVHELDALAAAFARADYRRGVRVVTREGAALAYRVLREGLTNAARYAVGATVRARVDADGDVLLVEVRDSGGTAAGDGLGTGTGLDTLRRAVAEAGGRLDAGPHEGGWLVRMSLPGAAGEPSVRVPAAGRRPGTIAPSVWPRLWGRASADAALVVLAFALPLGACLIPVGGPDAFSGSSAADALLAGVLAAHAAPLAWRRSAPRAAAVAACAVVLGWLLCEHRGWTPPHGTDVLLWCWWADLVLVHAAASRARRPVAGSWPVPLVVAAVAGAALAGDGVAHRSIAWAVFTAAALVPVLVCWAFGLRAGRRRRAGTNAWTALHRAVGHHAATAAHEERTRLVRSLRGTARAHVHAAVSAAGREDLQDVLMRSRAAMLVMQDLVTELRAAPADDDPPPTLAGLRTLAARHRAALRVTGPVRPLPASAEVTAYRTVEALIEDETPIALHHGPDGLDLTIGPRRPGSPGVPRSLRDRIDAAGGTLSVAAGGTVRVWLPQTDPR